MSLIREANFVVVDGHYDIVIFRDKLFNEYLIKVYDYDENRTIYAKAMKTLPSLEEFIKLIKSLKKRKQRRMVYMNNG